MGDLVHIEKYRFNEAEKHIIQQALAQHLTEGQRNPTEYLKTRIAQSIMVKLGVFPHDPECD